MIVTTTAPAASTIPQYPIGTNPPQSVSWNPQEIMYNRLSMTDPCDPSTAYMCMQNYVVALPPAEADPVMAFVQMRADNPSEPVAHIDVYVNTDPNQGPCDVFLANQSFLIIEIDCAIPWQFWSTPAQAAITLKNLYQHDGDDDNFDLRCLDLDASGKFAAFSVAIRSASSGPTLYVQEGFNIALQSTTNPATTYIIDPQGTNQNQIPADSP